jgi:hypothetical protein
MDIQVDQSRTEHVSATVIQNIRTTGTELDDEELRLATGAMADPGGGVSYMGGSPGCWGDYDPNLPH